MILLLLLPALLIVLAARMSMEWLWFAQFSLESVLQQRWVYALGSAAAATLVVVCRRAGVDPRSSGPCPTEPSWLSGFGYSAALLVCLLTLIASTTLAGGLAVLAFTQPFALSHWPEALAQLGPPSTVLITVILTLALAAALRRRWLGWMSLGVSGCLIFVVGRAWGLWILAFRIPDSGFRDALLNTDSSFALGRFGAWRFGLELVLLLLIFHFSAALWLRLTRAPSLSDWAVARFEPSFRRGLQSWTAALFAVLSALVWLSRYQLLWTRTGVVAGAGWLQDHWLLPLRTGIAGLLLLASLALLAGWLMSVFEGFNSCQSFWWLFFCSLNF